MSKEKETILEKNRKAKCFSEIEVLDPKPSNVLKLRSFFENSGNRAQNRTKNTTPQTGRKKKVGKNFPPEGQKPISMFFSKKESGQQTPNTGKRKFKLKDSEFDFTSAVWVVGWFLGDYDISPNFLVVLGLMLWFRMGLGCDNYGNESKYNILF